MKFKNDRYLHNRGGSSRFLKITCRKCDEFVCYYQKDGLGKLCRLYLDRIIKPMVSLSSKALVCSNNHLMAVKIIHEREHRPAFRLFVEGIKKKIISKEDI